MAIFDGLDYGIGNGDDPDFFEDFYWRDTRHLYLGVVPRESGYRLSQPWVRRGDVVPASSVSSPGCAHGFIAALLLVGVAPRLSRRGLLVAQFACCAPAALVLSDIRTRSYALSEEHQVVVALTLPGMTWSGLTVRV